MLIINGKLITWEPENRILDGYALHIENGIISDIDRQSVLINKYPQSELLDAGDQYVMPGNICAHTHFYGAYARGLAIPGNAPKDFPEILEKLWWPLDLSLDEKAVQYSALVMLIDAIKHGTTTLFDHHASPNAIEGSLDVIANAVDESGLRAVLCYEVTDRNGGEGSRAGIRENTRFLNSDIVKQNSRIAGTFGLHASLTLTDETLRACREAVSNEVGYHIHVAEHEADEYDSLAKSGQRVVDRLHGMGILGPRTIVAHAIHIDAGEASLLAESNTWVTHQPRSNMNNGVGAASVESLMRIGIPVCIGTDGFSHTMWKEWQTAYLLHKVWHRDPRRMDGYSLIDMGVYNNAALAETFFPGTPIGVLTKGAKADIIFVDYHSHTPLTAANLPWHIVFGFHESMITTTIVEGRILMLDRELLTLDEQRITAQARELAPEVWSRYKTQF